MQNVLDNKCWYWITNSLTENLLDKTFSYKKNLLDNTFSKKNVMGNIFSDRKYNGWHNHM